MSELVSIEATIRTETGKGPARRARKAGKLPAALHTKGKVTLLNINPKWLSKACKTQAREFNLVLDGKTQKVKVQELHVCPVKRTALHVDLLAQ